MGRKPTPGYPDMARRIGEHHGSFTVAGVKEGINGQDRSSQPLYILQCHEHDPPHFREIRAGALDNVGRCAGQDYPTKETREGHLTRSRNKAYLHIEKFLFQEMGDHIVTGVAWEGPTTRDDPPFDVKLVIHCMECRTDFRMFQAEWKERKHKCKHPCTEPKRNGHRDPAP